MTNYEKRDRYIELNETLSKALEQEFYYEAIFIEYAIFEDRTESLIRHSKIEHNLNKKEMTLYNKINLIKSKEEFKSFYCNKHEILNLLEEVKSKKLVITETVKKLFIENNFDIPRQSMSYEDLLKRPEITFEFLSNFDKFEYDKEIFEQVEIELKYSGYIKKEYKEAEKLQKIEEKEIPDDIDYGKIKNLASEAKQKLNNIRPKTIAQASRISGVNPADISILMVYLKRGYNE